MASTRDSGIIPTPNPCQIFTLHPSNAYCDDPSRLCVYAEEWVPQYIVQKTIVNKKTRQSWPLNRTNFLRCAHSSLSHNKQKRQLKIKASLHASLNIVITYLEKKTNEKRRHSIETGGINNREREREREHRAVKQTKRLRQRRETESLFRYDRKKEQTPICNAQIFSSRPKNCERQDLSVNLTGGQLSPLGLSVWLLFVHRWEEFSAVSWLWW